MSGAGGVWRTGEGWKRETLIYTNHERMGWAGAIRRAARIGGYDARAREARVWHPHQRGGGWRCYSAQPKGDRETQAQRQPDPTPSTTKPTILPTHENIYTLPNFLTLTRLLSAPAVGYLLVYNHYPLALGLFVYAGVTDLVDGWIARRYGSGTVLGTILDPMADKALMTVCVVGLSWGAGGSLPVSLAILILSRDILLSLTAFYIRYTSLPHPRTLSRYWDFSLPSAEVRPTGISKVNTFLQLGLIGATMAGLAAGGWGEVGRGVLEGSWWVVGGTTVWSGLSYVGRGGFRGVGRGKGMGKGG
ncbi:hypothetical protein MMC21_004757 [Puttea exsequens]|nr:hypothetical protein [Puttea exsequens]